MKSDYKKSGLLGSILLLVLILTNTLSATAQGEIYTTNSARLIIKAHLDDNVFDITSKDLLIQLDYETGKVVMQQKISSLITTNDSLQSLWNNRTDKYIRFEGKLGLEYINTTAHPPLNFALEGTLFPGEKSVLGTGQLIHLVTGSTNACVLSLSFTLQPADVFPEYAGQNANDELHIQVIQSLLARENE